MVNDIVYVEGAVGKSCRVQSIPRWSSKRGIRLLRAVVSLKHMALTEGEGRIQKLRAALACVLPIPLNRGTQRLDAYNERIYITPANSSYLCLDDFPLGILIT
jgi:hypothetical protein